MADLLDVKINEIDSFTSGQPIHDLIINLVLKLAELPAQQTRFLSYNSLANIIKTKPSDPLLLQSVSILTAHSVNVLVPFFVYVGSEEAQHQMKPEEFTQAKRAGFFVDPITGEKDNEFLRNTYPYFSTTREFNSIQGVK